MNQKDPKLEKSGRQLTSSTARFNWLKGVVYSLLILTATVLTAIVATI